MPTPPDTIDKRPLHFTQRGSGLPLVLVHGFPLDCRMWEGQAEPLSKQARVITPDLRGFGQSRSDEPFTIASLAADLHALLLSIDALPCVLGGLSMGGYVALAFAHRYPADLLGLALIDTRGEADNASERANRDRLIALVRRSGAEAVVDEMMGRLLCEPTICHRPQVPLRLREIMEDCPAKTIEHALEAMRDRPDQRSNLASIPVRTLVAVGDLDVITPISSARTMQGEIPHSRLVIIPEAGHMSPMEQPAAVTEALGELVAQVKTKHAKRV